MYNYGILRFLGAKSVKVKPAIKAFLESENAPFTPNNVNKVNNYIQSNWTRFSSFIDKSIKSGVLNGHAVKLNTYYDELRDRKNEISSEFEKENLTKEEIKIITLNINEWGQVQSFVSKKGLVYPPKNYEYTSKRLQNMPIITLLRENNLVSELVAVIDKNAAEK